MRFWLIIALTLTLQEGVSTIAVLLQAYRLHYSLWGIHTIWLLVTSLQIILGYYLGKGIQKKLLGSKFEVWIKAYAAKLEKSIDKNGERFALAILASVISPAIATFLAAWLDISFANVFVFAFLGDLFWYASTWAYALGALALLMKVKSGLAILVVLGLCAFIFIHYRKTKKTL